MLSKFRRALIAFAMISVGLPASSAPISIDAFGDAWEVWNFRVVQGTNSWSNGGDFIAFGVNNVTPNGYQGTTASATQGGVTLPLAFTPTTILPNQFSGGLSYDPSLTGSWQITIVNGPDTLTVNTPTIGNVAPVLPVTALTMSGSGTAPTFTWTNPNNVQEVQINIFDLNQRLGATNTPNRIYANRLGTGFSTFTVPSGILSANGLYSIGFETGIVRGSGVNPSGSSQASAYLTSTYTYFDFSTGTLPPIGNIYLPVVNVSSGTPIFNFSNPVLAGQIAYYDPLIAIGYDFSIGAGDPLFRSVILPTIGDSMFDLFLDNGSGPTFAGTISAGAEYLFGGLGVSAFRIMGIERSAGLDPNNPTAFVTGLSFMGDGRFTGTMTPVIAPVPIPPALLGMVPALGLLTLLGLRRKATPGPKQARRG